mmetsp:Transcript_22282/g.88445  ORF Transcript_22282/g.88445 Transcript_22282/m.88445 type:complete len:380 (-) Transcript_22282:206-1345(-)
MCQPTTRSSDGVEFKASEDRRAEDEGELRAQTALEWIEEAAARRGGDDDSAFVTRSSLRSPRGTVELIECTGEFADALTTVGEGMEASRLRSALRPLQRAIARAVAGDAAFVCARRVPLHASRAWTRLVLEAVGPGALAAFDDAAFVVDATTQKFVSTAMDGAAPLSNDARFPGGLPDAIAVACAVPANRATSARLARVEDLVKALEPRSKDVLQGAVAFELRDDDDGAGGVAPPPEDAPKTAAPVLSYDDALRPRLQFSPVLRENVEWAPNASPEVCDALRDLDDVASSPDAGFAFQLRADDVLVFDARRWLYRVDLRHDDLDCQWYRGMWVPRAAVPPSDRGGPGLPAGVGGDAEQSAPPTAPLILRAWYKAPEMRT